MTAQSRTFLGIDVGTGGTRAVIVDDAGKVLGAATGEHIAFASPQTGWAEQDPADWWKACQLAVHEALRIAGVSPEHIACVGLTGQMHGAVLLDANGAVIRPSIIWCDQRTEEECRELTEKIGASRLIELTSNPALTNFTVTKLLWVRKHEPANWKRIASVLLPKDYIRFRLTGEKAIDVAEASGTLMLDVAHRRWSQEVIEAAGVNPAWLPKLYESIEVSGRISAQGAKATGLREGTPVVGGAGDQAAGAVGMGIVRPGAVSATIGTSGVVFAATDRPALDPKGRIHTFCHAIPGRWHVMGVTQAAGLSLRWFRDNFGTVTTDNRDPYDRLADEAAKIPAGADGVLWAPYLMGERTPHLDPYARGALVGLAANHGRGHIIRAIMEGVAFSLRDTFTIFEEMKVPVTNIRLGGGGARSSLWRQIQADVYSHAVEIVAADEGAAYGSALLAGVGAGTWASVDEACDVAVKVATRVNPTPQDQAVMRRQYQAYQRLYPALRSALRGEAGASAS
ncbi:MAG TPA: xylulokinase [Terriglobales bacterium]|nr:xylulokinase [Terriglobales bacterium]